MAHSRKLNTDKLSTFRENMHTNKWTLTKPEKTRKELNQIIYIVNESLLRRGNKS